LKRDAIFEEERKEREKIEEEEEKHLTLDQFLASKKTATSYKKESRKPEELKKANIEKATEKTEKISTI